MKKEDWKKMLDTWKESNKFQELKKKKIMKRQEKMTDEELNYNIDSLIEYDSMSDDDKIELDFIEEALIYTQSKGEIFEQYISQIVGWVYLLKIKEKSEKYELCAKIMKAIDIEKRELKRIFDTYFDLSEYDEELIEGMFTMALDTVNKEIQKQKND